MIPPNLFETSPEHIQRLVESEVPEGLTLEYKSELPTNQSDDKREFLYDVAAMANASGGHIIYGIEDRRGQDKQPTGIPERVCGIKVENEQGQIARLSNLIRDGIDPWISGIAMHAVSCPEGNVLIIRVPPSFNKPHMVTIGAVNKFYIRLSTSKDLMSVEEIGRAFSEQGNLGREIERWRSQRTALIAEDGLSIPLMAGPKLTVHVIPASAFNRSALRESWSLSSDEKQKMYVPHGSTAKRYNADGFLSVASLGSKVWGYTQIFRSGITEYVNAYCCFGSGDNEPKISGKMLEEELVNCYEDALLRLRRQGRSEFLYVGFSLTGIQGKYFSTSGTGDGYGTHQVLVDRFISPEVLSEMEETEVHPYPQTLRPLVDTMWQLVGREGTPYKSPNTGDWIPFGAF